jgi:hypothetical protein
MSKIILGITYYTKVKVIRIPFLNTLSKCICDYMTECKTHCNIKEMHGWREQRGNVMHWTHSIPWHIQLFLQIEPSHNASGVTSHHPLYFQPHCCQLQINLHKKFGKATGPGIRKHKPINCCYLTWSTKRDDTLTQKVNTVTIGKQS